MEDLSKIRENINEIDNKITELWKERMAAALKVAQYKKENGLPVLDSKRERELLDRIADMAGDELGVYARVLYDTVMSISRSYQHQYLYKESGLTEKIRQAVKNTPSLFPQRAVVACQGVEGAYSGLAAERIFKYPNVLYFKTWNDVVNAVEKGLCKYGILPIENSTAGSVNGVYDLMAEHNFYIVRSIRLKINHCLLGNRGAELKKITEIYSHEQAINQCSEFLREHGDIKVHICENTAVAAKMVMESGRTDVAAISSENCRDLYGLSVLSDAVQNKDNNYTRFICISKDMEVYPGADKTSMVLTLPHRPGSLYQVLARFYALGININKLESRPMQNKDFEFMFYFDMSASVYDDAMYSILEQLSDECERFHYLGSYSEVM
ncbi:MAG: chorismate mutase [Oscillospiraceae bacterium]|nr:chorismate mutase [Oscillospiraceae bacterium]